MAQGTQAHERLQGLIEKMGAPIKSVQTEIEIKNEYPPIRGFIDLVINWDDEEVLGEIKTAKQEVWDTRQAACVTYHKTFSPKPGCKCQSGPL